MAANKHIFKKILVAMVWILLSSGIIVLLIAAITRRNNQHCTGINIKIEGVQNNFFVDKKEVINVLQKTNGGKLEKKPLHSIDLALMETELQKSKWIKKAELFFDNNNVLEVRISEREPIARIFTTSGLSFYLDSSLTRLPLSDKFSARLPVFTNFPTDVIVLSKEDSNLIKDIRILGEFIEANPFWMAQIDQVDISANRTFDLIPKLGNQIIHFGNAENYQEKFNNLLCFYKQVLSKKGWDQYSSLDVQFKRQIVAVRRDAREIKTDSLRSVQIMKELIAEAQKNTNDSGNIQLEQHEDNNSIINGSKETEDIPDENVKQNQPQNVETSGSLTPIHVPEKPVTKNPAEKKNISANHPSFNEKPNPAHVKKQNAKKVISKLPETVKRKPKAVMPSKSDY
jgi:cell division protein FtsQ